MEIYFLHFSRKNTGKKMANIIHILERFHGISRMNKDIRMPQSLSELTPIILYMELTHLGSEATNYHRMNYNE